MSWTRGAVGHAAGDLRWDLEEATVGVEEGEEDRTETGQTKEFVDISAEWLVQIWLSMQVLPPSFSRGRWRAVVKRAAIKAR
jgi:hypothetical protein